MNDALKVRLAVGFAAVVVVLLAVFGRQRDREREQKLERALAETAKDREATIRIERLHEEQAWAKLVESAEALSDPGLKEGERAAAVARFRGDLQRVKSRYAYPQLGAGR